MRDILKTLLGGMLLLAIPACNAELKWDAEKRQRALEECEQNFPSLPRSIEYSRCIERIRADGDLEIAEAVR